MKFRLLLYCFIMLLFISVTVQSQGCSDDGWKGYGEINKNKTVVITCPTCSYINFTLIDSTQKITLDNVGMVNTGSTFYYTFLDTTLNKTGTYTVDGYSNLDIPLSFCFDITPSGKSDGIKYIFVNFILFLFIISIILGFAYFNRTIDFEKLHNKILEKFEDKNPVKALFYSLLCYLMISPVIIYYLLGFPLLLIIEDIIFKFDLLTMHILITNVIDLYSIGLFIVGLMFIGDAYQFLVETWDKFEDLKWGIEE